ncbi:multicopper oxidase family protein [Salinisphaera sp. Q1T1-3]|uniref:multicopper oxidase family protein n=1 Tax=Salinisphaera sp. Q1T1-3 TaxID=2321229 RepID=UPI000E7363FD|nr:multicopper oxidase [Salinisphaera sp. Q1T1-3]RJS95224.1 bilirubin oxidase [Salinisphaera sp. Q1T1-3]
MNPTRRRFILGAAGWGGALSTGWLPATTAQAAPDKGDTIDPRTLASFVDALPIPPQASPTRQHSMPDASGEPVAHYRIDMHEAHIKVHRDLPATRMWTYNGHFPGPTIEVVRDKPITVEWVNKLPPKHFLPVDFTICGMEPGAPTARSIVHVHGGRTPSDSDGYPEDWYTPGNARTSRYPNGQPATTLWYHDHAMGTARLNHYAGLMGFYLIRDAQEAALALPRGGYEIPLMLTDRSFGADGSLYYPTSGVEGRPWVAEVRGNAILVNGKYAPYLDVEPTRYRFRVVNASNQRFFRLKLAGGRPITQIGSDQGLLAAPAERGDILLAPAERADVIVDFSTSSGSRFTLNSDGVPIMQFRVAASPGSVVSAPAVPDRLASIPAPETSKAVRERHLSLDEYFHTTGRSMLMLLGGKRWYADVTEDPVLGTQEIWHLINTTEDTHPIHLHLVRFRVLDRRPFDVFQYQNFGHMRFLDAASAPNAGETGWKDTVQAHAGMVTRILVPFDGYPGRYVWHCHIWEHAANEMMRPYVLRAPDDDTQPA